MKIKNASMASWHECISAWEKFKDVKKAIEFLRSQTVNGETPSVVGDRSEGIVFFQLLPGRVVGAKVSCDTDFLSGNERFRSEIKELVLQLQLSLNGVEVPDVLMTFDGDRTLGEELERMRKRFGERISVEQVFGFSLRSKQKVMIYNHVNLRDAVCVVYEPLHEQAEIVSEHTAFFSNDHFRMNETDQIAYFLCLHAVSLPEHFVQLQQIIKETSVIPQLPDLKMIETKLKVVALERLVF